MPNRQSATFTLTSIVTLGFICESLGPCARNQKVS